MHLGRIEEAQNAAKEEFNLHERMRNPSGQAEALGQLALVATEANDLLGADRLLSEAEVLFAQADNRAGKGKVHLQRALVHRLRGLTTEAEHEAKEAATIFEEMGDEDGFVLMRELGFST